jgi:hypothetical protein
MSLLIVNAYLCDGFGARIYSSYYKQLLLLATVMYVNNTDLIHWAGPPSYSPSKLIATAQTATYAWGSLAIATGAAIGEMLHLFSVLLVQPWTCKIEAG